MAALKDGGASINFRRPYDKKALIAITNLRPKDILHNRVEQDIPVGSAEIVDKVSIPIANFDGVVEIPVAYDGRLSRLRTREHAFALGFSQSFEQTFGVKATAGGEAYGGSVEIYGETKFGLGSTQQATDTEGDQRGEDRGAGLNPTCPTGYDITFGLNRSAQPLKTRLTGQGDYDFALQIGKHWDGHWKGNKGEHGKKWPRWGQWDSWDEFMSVIKGEGRRDLSFAKHFWTNPAPDRLIAALEKPLDLPFDHTGDVFDGATVVRITQTVIRGPKYESQRLVIEDTLR